jgi:pyruvate/2-oxoacid:ferredoxin oxidoreductase alpha subunit
MEAIPRAKRIVVIDRDVSPGAEGIIAQEVKSALFGKRSEISVKGIIAGIGGRDVRPSDVVEIVSGELSDRNRTASDGESLWVEVMQ